MLTPLILIRFYPIKHLSPHQALPADVLLIVSYY
nr:MAG TPA: hypothetical protein [Caudoviricetes sp.]